MLTLWLDLPECHCTASHQALQAPLASFLGACLSYRVAASMSPAHPVDSSIIFRWLELDHLDLLASFDPARISPAEVSEVGMIPGGIPALWLDLQVPNQNGRPANPHSVARIFRVRASPLGLATH